MTKSCAASGRVALLSTRRPGGPENAAIAVVHRQCEPSGSTIGLVTGSGSGSADLGPGQEIQVFPRRRRTSTSSQPVTARTELANTRMTPSTWCRSNISIDNTISSCKPVKARLRSSHRLPAAVPGNLRPSLGCSDLAWLPTSATLSSTVRRVLWRFEERILQHQTGQPDPWMDFHRVEDDACAELLDVIQTQNGHRMTSREIV